MKNIERYLNTKINDDFYGKIDFTYKEPIEYLSEKEFKEDEKGWILAPYVVPEVTEKSPLQYREFMQNYHNQHKYCPKCSSEQHTTTLVAYVLDWDKKDEYKDKNRCECTKCGDKHSTHDRVQYYQHK